MQDVIVVGAGPAGSMAARSLAEKGYSTLVLENHPVAGIPQHCTGLISESTLDLTGVRPDVINRIHGMEFNFPDGRSFSLRSESTKAVIVDRVDLDQKLAVAAADAGAEFSYEDKYESHTVKDAVFVDTSRATYKSRSIIGADGAASAMAMSLGENGPKEYVHGIQVDVAHRLDDQDTFKVYVGNEIAPGFFAWEVPCGDFTRVGLCVSKADKAPSEYLSQFLIDHGYQKKVKKVYSGKIPLGGRQFVCGDRCLLAGDAAGFVKPLSGGGLYSIVRANPHLVDVLSACLDRNTLTSKDLNEYSKRCSEDFGKELDRGYSIRKKYIRFSDKDFSRAYDYIMNNNMIPVLNDLDIDHPTAVVKKAIRSPKAILSGIPLYMRTLR